MAPPTESEIREVFICYDLESSGYGTARPACHQALRLCASEMKVHVICRVTRILVHRMFSHTRPPSHQPEPQQYYTRGDSPSSFLFSIEDRKLFSDVHCCLPSPPHPLDGMRRVLPIDDACAGVRALGYNPPQAPLSVSAMPRRSSVILLSLPSSRMWQTSMLTFIGCAHVLFHTTGAREQGGEWRAHPYTSSVHVACETVGPIPSSPPSCP